MIDKYQNSVLPTFAPTQPALVRGEGSLLFDEKGKRYIDFGGGIAVNIFGHGYKPLVDAISVQATKLIHVSNLHFTDRLAEVASQLTQLTGFDKVFFTNSGVESNECALKIARKRGVSINDKKFRILSFDGSFHGRLGMSLAASGQPKLWQGHGPQMSGITHLPLHDTEALATEFNQDVCAVIVEPILGEGGINVVEAEFIKLIRQLCDKHDALLIFDEIQSGCGRTGTPFYFQQLGIKPDLLTSAKALGAGFPVGATLVNSRAAKVFTLGDHGTTFGGNPLAMAAVAVVIEHLADQQFMKGVAKKSQFIKSQLEQLAQKPNTPIKQVRGVGLMIGIQLDAAKLDVKDVFHRLVNQGLLVAPAADNVVRFLPALNIPDQLINEGMAIFEYYVDNLTE